MMKRIILAMAFVLAFTSVASAHDMWLEKKGRKAHLMYGHPGATDPYPISRITALTGINENGWKTALEPVYNKGEAYAWLDDVYTMLTVEFDNKYWYHTEEGGWQNFELPRQVCGKIIDEGRSYKLSKTILSWTPGMDKPIGQRAEIVPLKDPTKLKEGDILPVMMYYEGKPMPAAGARISTTSDRNIEHPELVNLKNSKPINVKIGPAGRQVIIGKYENRLDDTRRVWYAFSLTFRTTK
ncbi:DUF4198 domain-containing protein [Desulfovibrio sp. JC010]|uniref:DUF4198 domain-containing protein n=1 Tax=Desulfovibrio sp. JC010 TaxID=2593641 RepID=UPI0013D46F23|nr:DUF4198 domain-containing protein [Desulfovibrio sp. JC010]NDV25689.1 DUF4198 domain-containing protein [Desulfovibrio sp. JC010]